MSDERAETNGISWSIDFPLPPKPEMDVENKWIPHGNSFRAGPGGGAKANTSKKRKKERKKERMNEWMKEKWAPRSFVSSPPLTPSHWTGEPGPATDCTRRCNANEYQWKTKKNSNRIRIPSNPMNSPTDTRPHPIKPKKTRNPVAKKGEMRSNLIKG